MVPHLAVFTIYTLFKQIAHGREAVYSLFAEIMSFFISECTQHGRTLPFVVALLSVGIGQLQMEGARLL